MPDNPSSNPTPSQVVNNAPKPPGILPKNAQLWLMIGISVVMVLVIALSGNPIAKEKAQANAPKQQNVIDPNAARIAEYRNRIEEEARKLEAEQARLNQAKKAFGLGGQPTETSPASPSQTGYPVQMYQPPAPEPRPPQRTEKDQLEVEKEKREYLSLFASNVALTYRKDAQPQSAATPAQPIVPPVSPYLYLQPPSPPPVPAAPALPREMVSKSSPEPANELEQPIQPEREPAKEHAKPPKELTEAAGKNYRLFEGTIIEAVLTNRLNGAFSGPVNGMVTTNVYSHDRQQLLIPQGSRVLGEVKRVETFGQQRLAVVFHRIVMPDGFSVSLDQFKGLNQIGETGLKDKIDHHYRQVFGVSIALGAIAGFSNFNARTGADSTGLDTYRQGFSTTVSQSAVRILDRYLNILPTLEIREGHRIKIYLSDDLLVPAYDRHKLPSDL